MRFERASIFCWTDSTIVRAWIKGDPSRWSAFVANRVAEIQRSFQVQHWHHIGSEDNPADCATRGVYPGALKHHPLWWTGPVWLQKPKEFWPSSSIINDTMEEIKTTTIAAKTTTVNNSDLKDKYSSLTRLLRIPAYCLRFIHNNLCASSDRNIGPLSTIELQAARMVWIKDSQKEHLSSEISCLQRGLPINRSSSLRSLNNVLH